MTQALYGAGLLAGICVVQYQMKRPLKAAVAHLAVFGAPILASGLGMMAYNQARFHSPWNYGDKYVRGADPRGEPYELNRVPENFRHYVLAPIRLSRDVPWISHVGWRPLVRTGRAEDMSSMFLASPFLLLGALAWTLFCNREPRLAAARVFAATALGSALLVFFPLLCFVGTSRRYMQDFVPMLMILAFVGVGARSKHGTDWRRWRKPAWTVLLASALLHAHLSFFQSVSWAPKDPNVMQTFVTWSPLVRRILPGHQLDAQEAIYRNDLGVMCLEQGRLSEAVSHLRRADELMPNSALIGKNLRLAMELNQAVKP